MVRQAIIQSTSRKRMATQPLRSSGLWLALVGVALGACSPQPPPASLGAVRSAEASPLPAATLADPSTWPTAVDGLPVMTVSELDAARKAGALLDGRGALRGWWSWLVVPFSCFPPEGQQPGELELRCQEGMYGIAERKERIGGNVPSPDGPWLQPVIHPHHGPRLIPPGHLQYPQPDPAEILVTGHFDDLRALECRPTSIASCRERFVLDRVVELAPWPPRWPPIPTPSIGPPAPSLPPGFFDPAECGSDTTWLRPFDFTAADIGFAEPLEGTLWGLRTDAPALVDGGVWHPGPDGRSYQRWAVLLCYAPADGDRGTARLATLPGTEYLLWDDGIVSRGFDPVRPPGFP